MSAWHEQGAEGETIICLGDVTVDGEALAHHQQMVAEGTGREVARARQSDVDPANQIRPFEIDRTAVTLYAAGDPPLLLTHVPLLQVPHGAVNVHGHVHEQESPTPNWHVNASVEPLGYRPARLSEVRRLARRLVERRTVPGHSTRARLNVVKRVMTQWRVGTAERDSLLNGWQNRKWLAARLAESPRWRTPREVRDTTTGSEAFMHRWKTFLAAVVVNGVVVGLSWRDYPQLVMMIAPAVFAGVPLVNTWIEERGHPTPISVQGFGLQWRSLVLFGALMMFISVQLTGLVSLLLTSRILEFTLGMFLLQIPFEQFSELEAGARQAALGAAAGPVLVLWGCPLFFVVGRWMGRRSMLSVPTARRVLGVVYATAISVAASTAASLFTLTGAPELSYLAVLLSSLATLLLVLVPALCGHWRGRRQVLGAYMGFLLTKVQESTRDIIVELAYEEATKPNGGRKRLTTR